MVTVPCVPVESSVTPCALPSTLMAKEWLAACGFDYNHVPGNG